MRRQILKLRVGHSTKAERIFMEVLKENHIPFQAKVKILEREVDFLLQDNLIVEINGHEQDLERNEMFIAAGYVPIHIHNTEIINNRGTIILKLNAYKN